MRSHGSTSTAMMIGNVVSLDVWLLAMLAPAYALGVYGLAKRFAGSFEGSVFYSYQRSYSVVDFTSSVARSNFINGFKRLDVRLIS